MTDQLSAEQLDAIPREHLRELGVRARSAAASKPVRRALQTAQERPWGMRLPMVAFELAALDDPSADLARLFCAGDSLTEVEAHRALSPALCEGLLAASVLTRVAQSLRARLRLSLEPVGIVDERPAFGAPQLARAVVVSKATRALCFGGDSNANLLAELAHEVVALDPSPRVAAMLQANAALGSVSLTCVERLGEDERFELVVLDLRSDDVVERAQLSRAISSLSPGGTLCAVVEAFDSSLLQALAPDGACQTLAVGSPPQPIDETCALRAAARHPELGEEYERSFEEAMALWTARKVSQVGNGALVSVRAEPPFRVLRTLERDDLSPFPYRRAFEACALATSDEATLLAARLAVPAGTLGRTVDEGFAMRPPLDDTAQVLGQLSAHILDRVHAAPTVRDALEALAGSAAKPLDETIGAFLPVVREALSNGLLEVAS